MRENEKNIDIRLLIRVISNEANDEEIQAVANWRSVSKENEKEFIELEKTWNILQKPKGNLHINIDEEWSKHKNKIDFTAKPKIRTLYLFSKIAAAILISVGLTYLVYQEFYFKSFKSEGNDIAMTKLEDATLITLNASSKVRYPKNFNKSERRVKLEGEAYFDVKKNKNSPFIIEAQHLNIIVIGTSFNVQSYKKDNLSKISVDEGMVGVVIHKKPNDTIYLSKNQHLVYNKQNQEVKIVDKPKNYISWITKEIHFEQTGLESVVDIINNTYHSELIIADNNLKNCTLTTSFVNDDLKTVLKIIKSTLDVSYLEKHGKIYIKGEGCPE